MHKATFPRSFDAELKDLEQLTRKVCWQVQRDTAEEARMIRVEDARRKARALRDYKDSLDEMGVYAPDPERLEIEGLFCVYGLVDTAGERANPGMFAGVKVRDVEYWHNHDRKCREVAEVRAIWEVTRDELPLIIQRKHPEATGGAVVVRRYDLGDATSRAAFELVKDGRCAQMSFGYHRVQTSKTWEHGREVTDLWEVTLTEISDVYAGACPGTMAITGAAGFSRLNIKGRIWR